MIDGLHSDASCVLAVALFVEIHCRDAVVFLGWVKGVEVAHVGTQLLHGAGTERVTRRDQHAEPILDQPETYLIKEYKKQCGELFYVSLFW